MNKEIRKLRNSFHCAVNGFKSCVQSERNLRIHLTAVCYVTAAAFLAGLDAVRLAILCVCFALVMSAELMNTAIERLCDRQAGGYDSIVREAKDIAAAGVAVCAFFCVLVGVLFFVVEGAALRLLAGLRGYPLTAVPIILTVPFALYFIFGKRK